MAKPFREPHHHNQLEKDILLILRQSRYEKLSKIYKNFYAQSNCPSEVLNLFATGREVKAAVDEDEQ